MPEQSPAARVVSVTELRRCPSRVLDRLCADERCTVTRRGRPIADVVAHQEPRWIPADRVRAFFARSEGDS